MLTDSGHTAGTAAAGSPAPQGAQDRRPDRESCNPGWPRLLNLRQGAAYLGCSYWTLRDLVAAGIVPRVSIPSPRTDEGPRRSGKGRRYQLTSRDTGRSVRKLLVDRLDLDRLVDGWREEAGR